MAEALTEYLRLFREEKFFEAHEVLEALWRKTNGRDLDFYHGLIQLAALLVHYQKGNLSGARELFRTASGYLKPYLPAYRSFDLSRILRDFETFLQHWSEHPGERKSVPVLNVRSSNEA